ncbi:deoxyhypusine synthase [Methanofollis fontis]|uniref:Deoxyhypusine synthase n=1 Tax=Methanofollis fontis TaxID=2052832 RepID=A0A483CQH2_9EURY|nr:deoxyhypusine synthase [Methanofollis fontis]TAJ45363.1 deoxyhypusine synthase [Methanofollis fontis]
MESNREECAEPVRQLKPAPDMTADALVRAIAGAGAYNGGALARATDIYETMLRDEASTNFFGLAGAMVPAGMGGIVSDLIERGHIDILVSTGANLTHDTIEAIGCHHYRGSAVCDDVELRHEEINRIYDIFLPDEAFVRLEEFMQDCLSDIPDRSTVSISGLLRHIGERLESGILATAARYDVPVFCPAVQDSMLGLQFWVYNQMHGITVDAFGDMREIIDRCYAAEHAGAFLVGGGVPKNFIFQSKLITPSGFDYAVQLTGDRPDLGGLSGATLTEAQSWGKINEDAAAITVYGDATINLPLITAAVLERLEHD